MKFNWRQLNILKQLMHTNADVTTNKDVVSKADEELDKLEVPTHAFTSIMPASPHAIFVTALGTVDANEARAVSISLFENMGMRVVTDFGIKPDDQSEILQGQFFIHKPLTRFDLGTKVDSANYIPVLALSSNEFIDEPAQLLNGLWSNKGKAIHLVVASHIDNKMESDRAEINSAALADIRDGLMSLEGMSNRVIATVLRVAQEGNLIEFYEDMGEDLCIQLENELIGECENCFVVSSLVDDGCLVSDDGTVLGSGRLAEWIATEISIADQPHTLKSKSGMTSNRALIVLADVESARLWTNNCHPIINSDPYAAYKTQFFGTYNGATFIVAPKRNETRLGLAEGKKEASTTSSYYYIAPDVTIDVVTKAEYSRCLQKRTLLRGMAQLDEEHLPEGEGESEDTDNQATLAIIAKQLKATRGQYASVMVIASPREGGAQRLQETAMWARQNVFTLYTSPSSLEDNDKIDGQTPQAVAFIGIDCAENEAQMLETKPFYGDFFLGDQDSTARDVDTVWLSEWIDDMKADAQLHDNNTLSDSDSGYHEKLATRNQQTVSTGDKISISIRHAMDELFRQHLERAEWPQKDKLDKAAKSSEKSTSSSVQHK